MSKPQMSHVFTKCIVCGLVVGTLALTGCAGVSSAASASASASSAVPIANASSKAAEPITTVTRNYEWIEIDVPAGWTDTVESKSCVTIRSAENNKQAMTFLYNPLSERFPTAEAVAEKDISSEFNLYTDGGKKTIGGHEWIIAEFEEGSDSGFIAYTDITEERFMKIAVYNMEPTDAIVQTVFKSVDINQSELQ